MIEPKSPLCDVTMCRKSKSKSWTYPLSSFVSLPSHLILISTSNLESFFFTSYRHLSREGYALVVVASQPWWQITRWRPRPKWLALWLWDRMLSSSSTSSPYHCHHTSGSTGNIIEEIRLTFVFIKRLNLALMILEGMMRLGQFGIEALVLVPQAQDSIKWSLLANSWWLRRRRNQYVIIEYKE